MDFAQDVLKSLIVRRNLLGDYKDPRQLLGLFAGAARKKVLKEFHRCTRTEKRRIDREEPLYIYRDGQNLARELASPEPTPSEQAQANELMARLRAELSDNQQEILTLRCKGCRYKEISERTGIPERRVRSVLDDLRKRMDKWLWR